MRRSAARHPLGILAPLLVCFALLAGGGCDESDPAAPEPLEIDRFVGTWAATSWAYSPLAGGPAVEDPRLNSFRITIARSTAACSTPLGTTVPADQCATCEVDQDFDQDPGPRHLTGHLAIVSELTLWIGAAEAGGDVEHFVGTYRFEDADAQLILRSISDPGDDDTWRWDFDGDGEYELATLTIVLQRQ
jgi:hypothetical protein